MHPRDYTFGSVDSDKIRIWKCPEGDQLRAIDHPDSIVNTLAVNDDNVMVSGSNNGMLRFYDWDSGYNFQSLEPPLQPGTLSSEACIHDIKFDKSSMRMITAECDKTIKIWREDEDATPETHPINFNPGQGAHY
jgi:pleiotropic regulator 1